MIAKKTTAIAACFTILTVPNLVEAQFQDQSGYDPSMTAPDNAAETYRNNILKIFYSGENPRLDYNLRGYDISLCPNVIGRVNVSNPNDGNDWPESARKCLGEHGAFIAAPYPAAAIILNSINENASGTVEAAVQFLDVNGELVRPNTVAVYDLDRRLVAADFEGFSSTSADVNYHFLVDRSGSMRSSIDDVRSSVIHFAQSLPNSRECLLYSFASDFIAHSGRDCQSIGNVMNRIEFGGSTNLYTALDGVFSEIPRADPGSDRFDVVLVFSDGVPTDSPDLRARVQTAKTAPLFVYWMGQYNKDALSGIVDYEAAAMQGPHSVSMDTFLEKIGVSVEEQFVIRFNRPQ